MSPLCQIYVPFVPFALVIMSPLSPFPIERDKGTFETEDFIKYEM